MTWRNATPDLVLLLLGGLIGFVGMSLWHAYRTGKELMKQLDELLDDARWASLPTDTSEWEAFKPSYDPLDWDEEPYPAIGECPVCGDVMYADGGPVTRQRYDAFGGNYSMTFCTNACADASAR